MRTIGAVFTLLAVVACSKPAPVAQPQESAASVADGTTGEGPPAALVAQFARALALVDRVVDASEAGAGDCDAVARNLEPIASGPESRALLELDEEPAFEVHGEAIAAPHQQRLEDLFARLFAVVVPCQEHGGVIDALTRVGLAGSFESSENPE